VVRAAFTALPPRGLASRLSGRRLAVRPAFLGCGLASASPLEVRLRRADMEQLDGLLAVGALVRRQAVQEDAGRPLDLLPPQAPGVTLDQGH